MPQVDLETFVCGGDRKITCESLVGDHHSQPDKPDSPEEEAPPDFPAESFQILKEEELEWFNRNALYERKESQKGNSNPNPNPNPISISNQSSQRFSLNLTSNKSIIGLPKPQKSCFLISKSRRTGPPPRAPFFPKKPSRSGKSLTVTEPSSPKVSCIGRVKSKKDKNRRCASGRQPTEGTTAKASKSKPGKKTGFWANLMGVLPPSCRDGSSVAIEGPPNESPKLASVPRRSFTERERKIPASLPLGEPTGLDGMKRFTSGRRSESWISDFDLAESVVVVDSDVNSIWRRRDVDPPKKIDCVRDWECEGPASV
ncbi:uncharacterized protein LOC122656552 [Telopea speciosissima]|uniref:uncharacterized protein LOC122656552 n=1 Tax=Telopea speciosissima TaxID=54955 RepID=UPI001CC4165E|nr:uncharacterized protein LOC122656552 [Telopea speciosissima]